MREDEVPLALRAYPVNECGDHSKTDAGPFLLSYIAEEMLLQERVLAVASTRFRMVSLAACFLNDTCYLASSARAESRRYPPP